MVYIQQTIQIIVIGSRNDDSAPIPSEEAEILANNLIITCRLARGIIAHDPSPRLKKVAEITVGQIDQTLESAKQSFPELSQGLL
jgi:hypothetical protein